MKLEEKYVLNNIEELGFEGAFDLEEVNNVYDIITIGNKILRNENKLVDITAKETKETIINMVNSLYHWCGCGIAAPQIGKNEKIFIVKVENPDDLDIDDENREYFTQLPLTVFVNPNIIEYSEETNWDYEGCLSVSGFVAMVKRSNRIVIEFTNQFGEKCVNEYTGFVARAIQHEYDHLQGMVYTDIADMTTFSTRENLHEG